MHLAADYGQLEVLEYLAAQGADINAKDKHGISVILAAIWEGHSKCVKFLLDKVSIKPNCFRINVLHHHHFYLPEVKIQVQNGQGGLGSLVPSILDIGLVF